MFRFSKNSDEFSNISYNISHKNWKFFKTDYFLGVMGKLDEVYHKKDLNTLQEITNSKSPVTDDSLKKMKEILNKNYFLSKSQLTEEQRQVIKENLDSNNAAFFQSDDWKEMLTILNKSYKQDELNKLHNVVDLIS